MSNPEQLPPGARGTVTVRVIKSLEYRTLKSLVLLDVDLAGTTVRELKDIVRERIKTSPGFRPYLNGDQDTFKLYVAAMGTKSSNLVINTDHDDTLILVDDTKTLAEYGVAMAPESPTRKRSRSVPPSKSVDGAVASASSRAKKKARAASPVRAGKAGGKAGGKATPEKKEVETGGGKPVTAVKEGKESKVSTARTANKDTEKIEEDSPKPDQETQLMSSPVTRSQSAARRGRGGAANRGGTTRGSLTPQSPSRAPKPALTPKTNASFKSEPSQNSAPLSEKVTAPKANAPTIGGPPALEDDHAMDFVPVSNGNTAEPVDESDSELSVDYENDESVTGSDGEYVDDGGDGSDDEDMDLDEPKSRTKSPKKETASKGAVSKGKVALAAKSQQSPTADALTAAHHVKVISASATVLAPQPKPTTKTTTDTKSAFVPASSNVPHSSAPKDSKPTGGDAFSKNRPTIALRDEDEKKMRAKVKALQPAPPTSAPTVVYLGRIPHGFVEEGIRGYFEQFGEVGRVRVARNKKTGHSKHYAFLEFPHPGVAAIVVSTMHNYLLSGHLLKCSIVPPEKVHPLTFAGGKFRNIPWHKIEMARRKEGKTGSAYQKGVKSLLRKEKKRRKMMLSAGIEYEFGGYPNGGSLTPLTNLFIVLANMSHKLTNDELDQLAIPARLGGMLGIFSVLTMYHDYWKYPKHRTVTNRMVMHLATTHLVSGATYFVSRWGPTSEGLCETQGFFVTLSIVAGAFIALAMGINMSLVFVFKWAKTPGELITIEKYQVGLAWGISFLVGFPFMFVQVGNKNAYNDVGWFSDDRLKMGTFYYPSWIIILFDFVICGIAGYVLNKKAEEIRSDVERGTVATAIARSLAHLSLDTNKGLQSYVRKTNLHVIVFCLTYVFPTINRLQGMADPTNQIFALYALQAFFASSRGLWTGLTYFYNMKYHGTHDVETGFATSHHTHSTHLGEGRSKSVTLPAKNRNPSRDLGSKDAISKKDGDGKAIEGRPKRPSIMATAETLNGV
ncbi:hypothetical protein HDU93_001825 [Gonapodya sp. JEL0774]|nr:hypothetical protein HDU93_001825 [Gonapodya sp. JEL0774]